MQEIRFNYFRGMEADQYTFYRIPKMLFTAECFRDLSCEAKVLYGLLLDRMGLSVKNRWFDDENRVYIIFKVEEIMELMCCKSQKATKLMKELDTETGIGLIEKKRLGLGRPNVIYVKNFMVKEITESDGIQEQESVLSEEQGEEGDQNSRILNIENPEFPESKIQNFENQKSGILENENQEDSESKIQSFENQKSEIAEVKILEFPESKIQSFENQKSGIVKITNQEFPKSKSNDTDINDTELNENENSETESIYPDRIPSYLSVPAAESDAMEEMGAYRNVIREHISYECFQEDGYHHLEEVDELVELIVEVIMMPDNSTIRIAGVEKPAAIVKNRFMKLGKMHMEYILSCLDTNTSKVGNIKSYLLTVLYNAPATISSYYAAEVNHDLYGSG